MRKSFESKEPIREVSEMDWEALEELVSYPGTITHLAYTGSKSRDPVAFWKRVAAGSGENHQSSLAEFGDTGLSVNVTKTDGSNPSLVNRWAGSSDHYNPGHYSIINRGREPSTDAVVIFSYSATDRIADSADIAEEFLWGKYRDDQAEFERFLKSKGMGYSPISKDWEITLSPMQQVRFAAFLSRCLNYGRDIELANAGDYRTTSLCKAVDEDWFVTTDFGYRFRGIFTDELGREIWGDLPLLATDVAAIAEPVIPGKLYKVTSYKDHSTIEDVLG